MNKKEQRIEELRKERQKKLKEIDVKRNRIRKREEKLTKLLKEVQEISSHLYWVKTNIKYEYEHKIQKLCDHKKYPVRKTSNMRDDASFKYWVFCSNCDADLGYTDSD